MAMIDIDIMDYIDELSDDDLLLEVHSRKLSLSDNESTDIEIVRDAYDALLRGHVAEARSILDRLLNPKWPSVKSCERDFKQAGA